MSALSLVYAPNPIFRKTAVAVSIFDDNLVRLISEMFDVLYRENGVGVGANMVGILQRIIVIDLQVDGRKEPVTMVNPEIIRSSNETQIFTEASLSFPGISAEISRPKEVTVKYQTDTGMEQELTADGFFATVIQHEIDYLNGRIFPDHLSRIKRASLLQKYNKKLRVAQTQPLKI